MPFAERARMVRSDSTAELFPRDGARLDTNHPGSSGEAVGGWVDAEQGGAGRPATGEVLAAHEGAADHSHGLGPAALDQDDPPGGLVRAVAQLLLLARHARGAEVHFAQVDP